MYYVVMLLATGVMHVSELAVNTVGLNGLLL